MGYANPMTIRGADWFAAQCEKAGVDGVICVDIPPRRTPNLARRCARGHGFHPPCHPTTDAARLPAVLEGSSGFLYYVSVAGITGKQQAAVDTIREAVARLKAGTSLPVAVGFGVRTPEQAAAFAQHADGVVVGSALVDLVAAHGAAAPARGRTDPRLGRGRA
jgi:tryptophan synthase alpha chain